MGDTLKEPSFTAKKDTNAMLFFFKEAIVINTTKSRHVVEQAKGRAFDARTPGKDAGIKKAKMPRRHAG